MLAGLWPLTDVVFSPNAQRAPFRRADGARARINVTARFLIDALRGSPSVCSRPRRSAVIDGTISRPARGASIGSTRSLTRVDNTSLARPRRRRGRPQMCSWSRPTSPRRSPPSARPDVSSAFALRRDGIVRRPAATCRFSNRSERRCKIWPRRARSITTTFVPKRSRCPTDAAQAVLRQSLRYAEPRSSRE